MSLPLTNLKVDVKDLTKAIAHTSHSMICHLLPFVNDIALINQIVTSTTRHTLAKAEVEVSPKDIAIISFQGILTQPHLREEIRLMQYGTAHPETVDCFITVAGLIENISFVVEHESDLDIIAKSISDICHFLDFSSLTMETVTKCRKTEEHGWI